ncbi:hypothetical protein [uncultured Pseudosulfitobacter sp.]|uniref:hypothetical protein n=1 Tax=uncultured Pseudosulfitobacter sp. TaxID=2854214 RepID=UPI0030D94CF5
MSIHDIFEGSRLLTETVELLAQRQLYLTVGDDFNHYKALISQYRPNQPVSLPFDPAQSDLSGGQGFWSVGRNPQGKIVQTQAVRLIDLQGQTLADYMERNFRAYPPSGVPIDLDDSWYRSGPGARRMSGLVCYHGEMWINPEEGNYRGRGIVDILARFAFLSSQLHWQPDYVFGFMPRAIARRGLAEREGYMHVDPLCLSWKITGQNKPVEGNMVYMGHEDIQHIIQVPLELAA